MEWVETTGRTVDAALDAALDELGVDEDDVEFEVLSEPKSGFLGLGGSDARIRARVKPISREKPGERQRRRGRKDTRSRNGGNGGGRSDKRPSGKPKNGASGDDDTKAGDRSDTGNSRDSGVSRTAGAARAATGDADREGGTTGGTGATRRRRRGGRGRGGSGGAGQAGGGGSAATAAADGDTGERPAARAQDRNRNQQESRAVSSVEDVPIEEQAAAAEEFTRGLVEAFDLGGTVETVIDDDVVTVEVRGDNLGLLVGPKGNTLHAIEELVRTVVQRQTDGHGVRIHVDVAGYRAKRRAALEDFTRGLVEKVLDSGKAQALEPMSSSDRKVVHDTAATFDGIATESEGEDPRRRVIIRRA
jgi:spoIIIJ-associated protein